MRQHVVYILDLSMTLTFDLYMVAGLSLVSITYSFYLVSFCLCMIYLRGVGMFVGLFFKLIVLTNGFFVSMLEELVLSIHFMP